MPVFETVGTYRVYIAYLHLLHLSERVSCIYV
jgi:hypothetical protein